MLIAKVLKIQGPVSSCTYFEFRPNCSVSSLTVTTYDARSGYVGTNAFGVTKEVMTVARRHYGIILRQFKGFSADLELSMPPEQARETKDLIDVLVTVGPDPAPNAQYVVEGYTSSSPATISTPVETRDGYTYLNMPLTSVWLASRVSGKIFGKFTPTAR